MGLRDFRLPTRDIFVPGEKDPIFQVRGLSSEDAAVIVERHGAALTMVWGRHFADPGMTNVDKVAIAKTLIEVAPRAVADLIALAADEPEAAGQARRLPFTVQMNALMAISALTFGSEGDVQNFIEAVLQALQATTGLMNNLSVTLT